VRPLRAKGADAPEELLENVCIQKWAASAWSCVVAATLCRLADLPPLVGSHDEDLAASGARE
jgi:hypothetical protein